MINWVKKMQREYKNQILSDDFSFLKKDEIEKHDFSKSLMDSRFLFKIYVLSIWKKVFQN
jgi:hypothetical protein